MIKLIFLACVGCANSSHQMGQINPLAVPVPMNEEWSCNEMSWTPSSSTESVIRINTYDCKMTEGSIYVTKVDGTHLHYELNKTEDCEWKIMLMLKETTCNDIKDISIVQEY